MGLRLKSVDHHALIRASSLVANALTCCHVWKISVFPTKWSCASRTILTVDTNSLNTINWSVFVAETQFVLCEVGNYFFLYRLEEGWRWNRCAARVVIPDVLPRLSGFDPWPIRVRFVVDQVTLERILFRVLGFSPVVIIPPMLHVHLNTNFPQ